MTLITPILLAGGSGSRLWPSSRETYPKQFMKLTGNQTLFQQTAFRVTCSDSLKFNPPITVTSSNFRFIVNEQLQAVGNSLHRILIEPEAKNTAPAIIAATLFAQMDNKNEIIIVTPTDHVVSDTENFNKAIKVGLEAVENGKIVTFGIKPTYPETGYGYLQLETSFSQEANKVLQFIEKPDEIRAKEMIEKDNFFWNAGIFMFRANDMISAFNLYAKDMLTNVSKSVDLSFKDLVFTRLHPKYWGILDNISIDYAIMEKVKNLVAIPYFGDWSDLGDWKAVWRQYPQDKHGVALSKNAHSIDCKNSLLRSEDDSQQIIGLGLEDIVAIAMPDAVLVANKSKTQDVKNVVQYLKSKNISQSEKFRKDHRPWGWFETLSLEEGFQVKKIFVKSGAVLSLQSHKYRSEHWVIVKGLAKVTIDKKTQLLSEGESTYVPSGSKHRIQNYGKALLIIIEVQIGSYLGEDDIKRYEDIYSRK